MPRQLSSAHGDLISSGHCEEVTTLTLVLMDGPAIPFTADAAADTLTSAAHGLSGGDEVVLRARPGYFLPKPLQPETVYHARDVTADALKLAATPGGPAVDVTWAGTGSMTLTPVTVLRLATADVTVGGLLYAGHLRPTEGLKLTKTASLDRFAARVQNADRAMGLAVMDAENALEGALAVIGTVHVDPDSGAAHYDPRLPGLVVGAQVDEATSSVSFAVVSDVDEAEYAGDLLSFFFPAGAPPPAEDHGVTNDLPPVAPVGGGRVSGGALGGPGGGPWRHPPMLGP
jgi:hypothetical protein